MAFLDHEDSNASKMMHHFSNQDFCSTEEVPLDSSVEEEKLKILLNYRFGNLVVDNKTVFGME